MLAGELFDVGRVVEIVKSVLLLQRAADETGVAEKGAGHRSWSQFARGGSNPCMQALNRVLSTSQLPFHGLILVGIGPLSG